MIAEYSGLLIEKYSELIFSAVLMIRNLGLTWFTVNMLNGILLLLLLFIAYKAFKMAEQAMVYLIVLALITLPFIFLIISSFFYKGKNLNQMM